MCTSIAAGGGNTQYNVFVGSHCFVLCTKLLLTCTLLLSFRCQYAGADLISMVPAMRTIFHCDINNCFASIEMAMNPELRRFPVAVCGDPALRRGIVLAKSELAKKCGVATGDPLWLARQKCPQIRFVLPHFEVYERYCRSIRRYYAQYV